MHVFGERFGEGRPPGPPGVETDEPTPRLVALEPRQADLLARIVGGPTIDSDTLRAAGSLGDASGEGSDANDDTGAARESPLPN